MGLGRLERSAAAALPTRRQPARERVQLVGRRFWVGEVLCEGTRLCEPCQYLTELTGKPLLRALVHRGGLRAEIVRGGRIRRGDRLRVGEEVGRAASGNKGRRAERA